jgi:isoleucyl-tRNA synthetase
MMVYDDVYLYVFYNRIISYWIGEELRAITYHHPFTDELCHVLSGTHVTEDHGTGFVHTAPAHGLDDYLICKKAGIDFQCIGMGRIE